MEYDLHSRMSNIMALTHQSITTNTTTVGASIDTQGFEALEYIIASGTITDGAYAILLEESDDNSTWSTVTTDETLGALTGFAAANDNKSIRVGSIGKKRYQRMSLVSTTVTTGADFVAVAVLGHPYSMPVAQLTQ